METTFPSDSWDIIIIGSGIGGLTASNLLAYRGKKVLICESHAIPGGAAHSFTRQGFHFDSGPSFYCGLTNQTPNLNPLTQVLDLVGESLDVVKYDPLGHYHFPEAKLPIYSNLAQYRDAIATTLNPQAAQEFAAFEKRLLSLYDALKNIPAIALRSDWKIIPTLLQNYFPALLQLLPQLPLVSSSVGTVMDKYVQNPFLRRLIDIECFLLSGLPASGTIAPEFAFMLGERTRVGVEYPVGGSGAIINALVRGFEKHGGKLYLNDHVEQTLVKANQVPALRLKNGETLNAPIVISNATIWDTYNHLLNPDDLPPAYRQEALQTPTVESFMHLHLGIKAEGLDNLTGHHVVIHDSQKPITTPGNTCMISIPSVWDANLAPPNHHVVHAYTLEPYQGWEKGANYQTRKSEKAETLYQALEKVIPDVRQRLALNLIGTPLTHARYLRRYQGTYGPAIAAEQGMFPSCHTPITGLYRVGDSTTPGIGVPAVAASGILCANTLQN
jgi:carotene isomerase